MTHHKIWDINNLHRKQDFSNIWRKVLELSDAGASCQNTKEPFEWYLMVLQKALLSVKMVPGAETAGYQTFPGKISSPARRNLSGISRSPTSTDTINIFKWYSMVLYFSKSSSGKSVLASDFALSGEITE